MVTPSRKVVHVRATQGDSVSEKSVDIELVTTTYDIYEKVRGSNDVTKKLFLHFSVLDTM